MSLVAHYRMDGDANDWIGGYNGTVVGTEAWSDDAQLGMSSDMTSQGDYISVPDNNLGRVFNSSFSISLWYKMVAFNDDTKYLLRYHTNSSKNEHLHLVIRAGGNIAIGFHANDYNSNFIVPEGEWVHYSFVCNAITKEQALYVNGEFYGSRISPSGWLTVSDSELIIGSDVGSRWPNGYIDDVRIYDHVLSEYEVKQIYHALIFSPNIDDMEEPTTNLLPNPRFKERIWPDKWGGSRGSFSLTGETYNGGDVLHIELTSDGNTGVVSPYENPVALNEVMTVSMDVRANRPMNLNYVYLMRRGVSNSSFPDQPIGVEWRRIETTITNSTANDNCGVLVGFNASLGDWIEVTNIQFERKEYATEFVDGQRTEVVADRSYQQNVVTDSYNIQRTFPRIVKTDAPTSKKALEFDGVDDFIRVESVENIDGSYEYTAAMWVYFFPDALGVNSRFFWHGNYSVLLRKETNEQVITYIQTWVDGVETTVQTGTPNGTIEANKWYHLATTYDGSTVKVFVNGELINSAPQTGPLVSDNNLIHIGATWNKFEAHIMMDDVRAYRTALADDEIYDLYARRASISSGGDFHSQNLTSYNKQGGDDVLIIRGNGDIPFSVLENNTTLYKNGIEQVTLNAQETTTVSCDINDRIHASAPFYHGDITIGVPMSWRGRSFASYFSRSTHEVVIFAPDEASTVDIYKTATSITTPETTVQVEKGGYAVLRYPSDNNVWIFESDGPVCIWIDTGGGDARPLYPCSYERYGIPSGGHAMAIDDGTIIDRVNSDGSASQYTLDRGQRASLGSTGRLYSGSSVKLSSNKPFHAESLADSNGGQMTCWTDREAMATDYVLARDITFLAFAGLEKGATVSVYDPTGVLVDTKTVEGSDPTKLKIDAATETYMLAAGTKIICSSPQWVIQEIGDSETNLYGSGGGYSFFSVKEDGVKCNLSEIGVTRGLVAWYPLDVDTRDYAGTHDGVNNGAVLTADGWYFDGVSYISSDTTFESEADGFYCDAGREWSVTQVFSSPDTTLTGAITGKGGGTGGAATYVTYLADGNIQCRLRGGTVPVLGTAINGQKHAVTITWDGSVAKAYVDGSYVMDVPVGTAGLQPNLFTIGATASGNNTHFTGTVYDVKVHSVALTPEEAAIEAKLALNIQNKVSMATNALYMKGQFKEVIS